jgi:hypothetical protein
MKTLIASALIICFVSIGAQAQIPSWKETFKQKKTQREYLAKQIVLLRLYLGYVRDGYNLVSRGWTTIEHIRNGEVNLHRDFFSSLKNVNPHIANSAKVIDVAAFQVFIVKELRATYNYCRTSAQFTPKEILYVYNVYQNMLFLTDANLSELIRITTSGEAEMSDQARIKGIDALYTDSLDKVAFTKEFSNDSRILAAARRHEAAQNAQLTNQYGLN